MSAAEMVSKASMRHRSSWHNTPRSEMSVQEESNSSMPVHDLCNAVLICQTCKVEFMSFGALDEHCCPDQHPSINQPDNKQDCSGMCRVTTDANGITVVTCNRCFREFRGFGGFSKHVCSADVVEQPRASLKARAGERKRKLEDLQERVRQSTIASCLCECIGTVWICDSTCH